MKKPIWVFKVILGSLWLAGSAFAAYNSGSTGADGAFNPTVSQSIQLPPDGVFNYTSVNIPAGVTITYLKNATNTPVTLLVSGDATIAGTLDVSATPPSIADISGAGVAGPGGYNGGRGGQPGGGTSTWLQGFAGSNIGRAGIGPGGGSPASIFKDQINIGYVSGNIPIRLGAGGGGAYGTAPAATGGVCPATPGATYGNTTLIPLIGGSGGGGGVGGVIFPGSGGGGGGGAILIAASGTIHITGAILANGGDSVSTGGNDGRGSGGGGGSGGAIRLIATTVSGDGAISAAGGAMRAEATWLYGNAYYICSTAAGPGNYTLFNNGSAYGGVGRIRVETENLLRTTATTPPWSGGAPSLAFVPGLPTLRIDSIGGIAVPAQPTGNSDVALPTGFTNPVTVNFVTSGVTVGSSILLTVTPTLGPAYSVTSAPTTGTASSAAASVDVTLASGPNTLQASVTYTVVASLGNAMSTYAMGERVEKVRLGTTLGSKESNVTLITVTGKEYVVPYAVLAKLPG
jgi:hypothetical protein